MTVKKIPTGGGTRDKILRAASRLFADHGYDGCSLRAIADQAKVNVGMIHYFLEPNSSFCERRLSKLEPALRANG